MHNYVRMFIYYKHPTCLVSQIGGSLKEAVIGVLDQTLNLWLGGNGRELFGVVNPRTGCHTGCCCYGGYMEEYMDERTGRWLDV